MPPAMPAASSPGRQLQSLGMRPFSHSIARRVAPGDHNQSDRLARGLPDKLEPFYKIAPEEIRVFAHWKVTQTAHDEVEASRNKFGELGTVVRSG